MTKAEYQEYLRSTHWIKRAEEVRWKRKRCADCGLGRSWAHLLTGQALNVHHLETGYERLGAERDEDLVLLCWVCHAKRHGLPAEYGRGEGTERIGDRWRMLGTIPSFTRECDLCSAAVGPRYFDLSERERELKEWVCNDCLRSAA